MSFLSKIFRKKETKVELSVKQLPKWVEKRAKQRIEEVNKEIESFFNRIQSEHSKVSENLDKLANAELHNPDMITRAKQIMAGNRDSYLKKVNKFLEMASVPDKITFSSTKRYAEDYDRAIKELTKTSSRAYYVVSEFFGNEISLVAKNIKGIDDQVKKINEFVESKDAEFSKIREINEALSSIDSRGQREEELKQIAEDMQKEQESAEKELKLTKARINSIRKSKAYSDYNELLKKDRAKEEELQSLQHEMISKFSILERALRKYSKITLQEKVVNEYLNNPLQTLLQDKELKLVGVLHQLKAAIENGELELKDKKKEKTLGELNKLSREYLTEFVKNHKKISDEIVETKALIKKNSANLEIKELEYKVEYLSTRVENAKKKEEQTIEDIANFDRDKLIKGIMNNIKDVFEVEVVLG